MSIGFVKLKKCTYTEVQLGNLSRYIVDLLFIPRSDVLVEINFVRT